MEEKKKGNIRGFHVVIFIAKIHNIVMCKILFIKNLENKISIITTYHLNKSIHRKKETSLMF